LLKDVVETIDIINSNGIYTVAVTNLPDLYQRESKLYRSKYIRVALGLHPELIHQYKHQIPLMWKLLPDTRYIGEVGLDFTDKIYCSEQIAFFEELVNRCRDDYSKIMTIHSRKAVSTVLDIVGCGFNFKPILHWFTGTQEELDVAIERGYYFSVNCAMISSDRIQKMLLTIPKERLLIETDAPFGRNKDYLQSLHVVNQFLNSRGCSPIENFRELLSGR
jgi:TatD DNase family protein